jgi:hypothetical protein
MNPNFFFLIVSTALPPVGSGDNAFFSEDVNLLNAGLFGVQASR